MAIDIIWLYVKRIGLEILFFLLFFNARYQAVDP